MTLYPEVQKKAQAEIDAVVGPSRLPDFEHRPSLPYINAVIKELMRWHSVTPFGGPFLYFIMVITILTRSSEAFGHKATDDDEYDGYYIPKGTVLLSNAWPVRPIIPTFCPDFLV